MIEQYCKVFLEATNPLPGGLGWVKVGWRTFRHGLLEIDVLRNTDRRYPMMLELHPAREMTDAEFIGACSGLLTEIGPLVTSHVAACDFEEQLPTCGGLAS